MSRTQDRSSSLTGRADEPGFSAPSSPLRQEPTYRAALGLRLPSRAAWDPPLCGRRLLSVPPSYASASGSGPLGPSAGWASAVGSALPP